MLKHLLKKYFFKWGQESYVTANPDLEKNHGSSLQSFIHWFLFKIRKKIFFYIKSYLNINLKELDAIYIKKNNRRFGNGVIAIAKAIYISKSYNIKLIFNDEYKLLKIKNTDIDKKIQPNKNTKKMSLKEIFYIQIPSLNTVYPSFLPNIIKENIDINISPTLKINYDPQNTLVIHIRSGDILKKYNPWYIQPPFHFYKKIIDDFEFKKILIVTESDMKNPCIQMIKEEYPQTIIQSSTLENDINTLLNAKFLVIGKGTFGPIIALLSKKIKVLFLPNYENAISLLKKQNSFKVAGYYLPNYENIFKANLIGKIITFKKYSDIYPDFNQDEIKKMTQNPTADIL